MIAASIFEAIEDRYQRERFTDADTPALGLDEAAVRNALHRLLREFRKVMQSAVRLTVEDEAEVPEELRHLLGLFPR